MPDTLTMRGEFMRFDAYEFLGGAVVMLSLSFVLYIIFFA
jgi:hypothetical protein